GLCKKWWKDSSRATGSSASLLVGVALRGRQEKFLQGIPSCAIKNPYGFCHTDYQLIQSTPGLAGTKHSPDVSDLTIAEAAASAGQFRAIFIVEIFFRQNG
ncbi:MAG: hypothetical protein IJM96_07875, partial [Clostridia bacterium]|nr:hypothetical protein [Clostridia bacterium]